MVLVLLFRGTSAPHQLGGRYGFVLAGSVPASFYGLEWQCGASQASEEMLTMVMNRDAFRPG